MLMMMRKVMIWKKGGQYDVMVVQEILWVGGGHVRCPLGTFCMW